MEPCKRVWARLAFLKYSPLDSFSSYLQVILQTLMQKWSSILKRRFLLYISSNTKKCSKTLFRSDSRPFLSAVSHFTVHTRMDASPLQSGPAGQMINSIDDQPAGQKAWGWSRLSEGFSVSASNPRVRRSSQDTEVSRSMMVSLRHFTNKWKWSSWNTGSYNLTVPNKQSRSSSKTRLEQTKGDHIRIEAGEEENGTGEGASPSPLPPAPSVQQTYAGPTTVEQTYELPAPATQQQQIVQQSTALQQTSTSSSVCQTSVQQSSTTTVQEVQQSSVEQSSSVVQQNSTQESVAFQQNAVQQSSTTVQSSSSNQESSHCSVQQSAQQSSSSQQSSSMVQSSIQQTSNQCVTQKQFVTESAVQQQSSVQQTSVQQSSQQTIQQQSVHQHSIQQQSVQQQSIQQQSVQQHSIQQQSIQQQSGKQRSRHTSGTQDRDTVVQSGGKFNITQGLNRRSRHQSGSQTAATQGPGTATQGPGAALRGLDTALEKIAAQQKKEETSTGSTTYVAKVTDKKKMASCPHWQPPIWRWVVGRPQDASLSVPPTGKR